MSESLPDFDSLWNYNQPAETEQKFRTILDGLTLPEDAPYRLQLLTQLARTQGLQRQFDEAHRTLDTVEPHINGDLVVGIRCHLERGRVYNSSRTPEKSRDHFMKAWQTALAAHEDAYAVDAAHMLAIIEPPEQQHEWNLKALDIVEKSQNPRAKKWAGSLYNNIGWTYHDAGDYVNALAMFEKALAFREAQKQERETRIARWAVGRASRSLGRVAEALAIQERLLKEWEQAGAESDGYVYEELAECYFSMGAGEEAKKYFALAYAAVSKDEYLVANESARLERLKRLSEMDAEVLSQEGYWNPENIEKWRKMSPEQFLSILGAEKRHIGNIFLYADMLRTNDKIGSLLVDDKLTAGQALDKIQKYASMLMRVMDVIAVYNRTRSDK